MMTVRLRLFFLVMAMVTVAAVLGGWKWGNGVMHP
jgi:hypothetical protein